VIRKPFSATHELDVGLQVGDYPERDPFEEDEI
jgi:hypothetical protein